MRSILFCALLAAPQAFAQQSATPLEIARAVSAEGPLYAFDMELITDEITARGKIDPTQPKGARIDVTYPAKEDWPDGFEKQIKEMDANVEGNIWCTDFIDGVPETAKLVSETDGIARYSFKPKAGDKSEEKFMKHLTGTIDIATSDGAILGFSMMSLEAFKPNVMVKIKSFQMDATCERGPDGRTYSAETTVSVLGSAAMQSFEQQETRKITKLYSID